MKTARRTTRFAVLLALLAAALVPVLPAAAEDEDDPREIAKGLVQLATPMVRNGTYFDAIRKLRKAVVADPANVDAALLLSQAYEHSG